MENKIKNMIAKVSKRKTELAELRGEKVQILKRMEEEDCPTIEDLDEEIKLEEELVKKLGSKIEELIEKLEDDFDWS